MAFEGATGPPCKFLGPNCHVACSSTHVHRDSEWTRIQTTAAGKTLLLGQIKMATHNLYTLMYKHLQRKVPARESEETMMQLGRVRIESGPKYGPA